MNEYYINSIIKHTYGEYDKERFLAYCKYWENDENNIDLEDVWLSGDREFFSCNYEIFEKDIENNNVEYLLSIIKDIRQPYIVYQFLELYKLIKGENALSDLINKSPACFEKNLWNRSCVLPVIIDVLLRDYTYKNHEDNSIDLDFITDIINRLCEHQGGINLIRRYSLFLLFYKQNYTDNIENIVEISSSRISESISNSMNRDNIQQLFPADIEKKYADFKKCGITQPKVKHSIFHEILSYALCIKGESVKFVLDGFKYSLIFDDFSFIVTNDKNKFKHYYQLADLYMELSDPVEVWIEHLNCFESIRYRIGYKYFDTHSIIGLRNLEYLLNVGKGVAESLLNENRFDEFDKIWNIIWESIIDINMYKKGYSFEKTFFMYIRYMIVLKFLALERQNNLKSEIADVIYNILVELKHEYKCFLLTVEILMQNGYNKYINYLNKDKISYIHEHVENIIQFYTNDKREENIVNFACKIGKDIKTKYLL